MALSPADLRRLKDAWKEAAENTPPEDTIKVNGLSAKELANEIENETKLGKAFIRAVDDVVSSGEMTLDVFIERLTRKPPAP